MSAASVAGSGVTRCMVVLARAFSKQLIMAPEVTLKRNSYVPSWLSVYFGLSAMLPLWTVPVQLELVISLKPEPVSR